MSEGARGHRWASERPRERATADSPYCHEVRRERALVAPHVGPRDNVEEEAPVVSYERPAGHRRDARAAERGLVYKEGELASHKDEGVQPAAQEGPWVIVPCKRGR